MSKHLQSQGSVFIKGANAFEPYMYRLYDDIKAEKFIDWQAMHDVYDLWMARSTINLDVLHPLGFEAV